MHCSTRLEPSTAKWVKSLHLWALFLALELYQPQRTKLNLLYVLVCLISSQAANHGYVRIYFWITTRLWTTTIQIALASSTVRSICQTSCLTIYLFQKSCTKLAQTTQLGFTFNTSVFCLLLKLRSTSGFSKLSQF